MADRSYWQLQSSQPAVKEKEKKEKKLKDKKAWLVVGFISPQLVYFETRFASPSWWLVGASFDLTVTCRS